MPQCDYCGSTILFGGVRDQGYRFCNAKCQKKGQALAINQPSPESLEAEVNAIHQGTCPRCGGRGPVDVHTSHHVVSIIVATSWSSKPHICCRKCGRNEQIKDALFLLALGWWGFPWGLVVTPIQIIRNVASWCRELDPSQPSPELRRLVQAHLGQTLAKTPSSPTPASPTGAQYSPHLPTTVSPSAKPMKRFFKFIQWLIVGLTGLFILPQLGEGQILPLLCLIAALVIILPTIEPLLEAKLPLLNKGIVKWLTWLILFITAMILVGKSLISISNVALCTQPQQGTCPSDVTTLFRDNNTQKLYLSATPDNIKDGTEFKWVLKYKPKPGNEIGFDSKTAKASIQDGKFLLEMIPKELPAGSYQLSISSDNKSFVTQTKKFRVWDGQLKALTVCTQPQQGQCQSDVNALVKNTQKLYLSATSEHLKEGTDLKWDLKYTPEPDKTSQIDSKTAKASVNDGKMLLEIEPKELPIGTYQLSLRSSPNILVTETKEFTVWDSDRDVQARLGDTLKSAATTLGQLKLCDRTGLPEPKRDSITQLTSKPDFCKADISTFKSDSKAIGFQLNINSALDDTKVKIIWNLVGSSGAKPITPESVKSLNHKTAWLSFTLSSPEGFPPGNYELIIVLETKNAKPIYRKFTVQ